MASDGINLLRTRQRLNIKKAGRYPLRERVGPAKNLLKKRKERRPARHKGTMVSAGVFCIILEQKRCFKLGGFMRSFAKNTDVKSLEQNPAGSGKQFQIIIYPRSIQMSSKERLFTTSFYLKKDTWHPLTADTCRYLPSRNSV